MIVDTSSLLAILFEEEDAALHQAKIEAAEQCRMSAGSYAEALIVVLGKKGYEASLQVETLLVALDIDIVPFTEDHAHLAQQAYLRFGKGRHAAGLNFGDCMTYALAKETDEPLLFKGEDFGRTDLKLA